MEYYNKTRWEGKSWSFKIKYVYAKYPVLTFCSVFMLLYTAIAGAIKIPGYENSLHHALRKYKADYFVFRDDDPNLKEIIEEKERGRHHFPKY